MLEYARIEHNCLMLDAQELGHHTQSQTETVVVDILLYVHHLDPHRTHHNVHTERLPLGLHMPHMRQQSMHHCSTHVRARKYSDKVLLT